MQRKAPRGLSQLLTATAVSRLSVNFVVAGGVSLYSNDKKCSEEIDNNAIIPFWGNKKVL